MLIEERWKNQFKYGRGPRYIFGFKGPKRRSIQSANYITMTRFQWSASIPKIYVELEILLIQPSSSRRRAWDEHEIAREERCMVCPPLRKILPIFSSNTNNLALAFHQCTIILDITICSFDYMNPQVFQNYLNYNIGISKNSR